MVDIFSAINTQRDEGAGPKPQYAENQDQNPRKYSRIVTNSGHLLGVTNVTVVGHRGLTKLENSNTIQAHHIII